MDSELSHSQRDALEARLNALVLAQDFEGKRDIVRTLPPPALPAAVALFEEVIESERNQHARDALGWHRDLLQRCADIGVEATFDELAVATEQPDLGAILEILARPIGATDGAARRELCERALTLLTTGRHPHVWATIQIELGNALVLEFQGIRTENIESALSCYDAALPWINSDEAPIRWAFLQTNLGTAWFRRIKGDRADNLERAIHYFEGALEFLSFDRTPGPWSHAQHNLAIAYSNRVRGARWENLEYALRAFEASLRVRTRQQMPHDWAMTQMNLANTYMLRISGERAENLECAIAALDAALTVRTRAETPFEWAMTQMNRANAFLNRQRGNRMENVEEAIRGYQAALEVFGPTTTRVEWAMAQLNLANAFSDRLRGDRMENLETAISGYSAALEVFAPEGESVDWATAQMSLSIALTSRTRGNPAGNIERAIAGFELALKVFTREALPAEWARVQMHLANALCSRVGGDAAENIERAISAYQSALEVFRKDEMRVDWAMTHTNLARAHRRRMRGDPSNNIEMALAGYHAALEVRTREAMPEAWARTQSNLAVAYRQRIAGNRAQNEERMTACCHAALEVMQRDTMPSDFVGLQLALADLFVERGDWDRAGTALEAATSAHEIVYRASTTPDSRRQALSEVRGSWSRLAYVLGKQGGRENLRKAVLAAEKGRARATAEALDLDEAPLDQVRAEHRKDFQAVRESISALQAEARLPEGTPGQRDFLTISSQLRESYADLEKTIQRIREYVPGFLPATSFADIQAAAECPLVYLTITAAGGLALVVRSEGTVQPIWLPDLTEPLLRAKLTEYLDARSNLHEVIGDWIKQLEDMLSWMGSAGIEKVRQALNDCQEAVLIPGGLLGLLPIHAAWTPAGGLLGHRNLFEGITIRYSPSARTLLTATRSAHQATAEGILAVANPRPTQLPSLHDSEIEVESALGHFERCTLFLHEEATREALLRELRAQPVLHFSCHGFASFEGPLDSGLVLANDEVLTLRSILNLRLRGTRLAVLSACETAVPGTDLPDEVVGLPSGLMQAGVKGIVGSLWPVDDQSTMMLMRRFYDLWREEGVTPAEALRKAQTWLRNSTNAEKTEYFSRHHAHSHPVSDKERLFRERLRDRNPEARDFSHPAHWASFCYFGA